MQIWFAGLSSIRNRLEARICAFAPRDLLLSLSHIMLRVAAPTMPQESHYLSCLGNKAKCLFSKMQRNCNLDGLHLLCLLFFFFFLSPVKSICCSNVSLACKKKNNNRLLVRCFVYKLTKVFSSPKAQQKMC